MPIKSTELEEPTLILTPMVDIVMLIMIFFMVSTEFRRRESQYEIQLPKVTEAQPLTALPDELTVSVQSDGTIHLGGETKTIDELELELTAAQQRYADQVVVIRGDGTGPYQHIMTVLNICRRAKITNIQLANQVEKGAR
ncbi:ExbD/TolR family protein [Planctomicrobium sp. SH661]|uniref:ExbD/TolR family protein n=1 Tax=Planctomicrobium sp. SH661 TaxID=3448124 RepID=UPI003F5B0155